MFRHNSGMLIGLALALVCAGATASANERDLRAKAVAASACEPANEGQANRVRLSNGAWVFGGNYTGQVQFYCPVSMNAQTLSNNSDDNDMSRYRVYYRDSDGKGNQSRVTARLVYRNANGLYGVGSTFNSNVSAATGNTTRHHVVNHDLRPGALYAFYVTLNRSNANRHPAFSGIDFPFPPIP